MRVTIDRSLLKSMLFLAAVIEARDPWTAGHIWRTSRYARMLAQSLGLPEGDVFLAQLGALVHDLGKIGMPDAILNKRGRITEKERIVMRLHPEIGYRVVANHPMASLVEVPILEHHMRMDGRGYPEQLSDREPAMISRIVSVADTFDAVTSTRPYVGARPLERAIEVLREERDRQLDGKVADALIALAASGKIDHILNHCGEGRLLLHCPDCGPVIAPPPDATDGDDVDCPSCTSEFVLHFDRDSFEVEWKGTRAGIHIPRPDLEAVEEAVRVAPDVVDVEPSDE